jgi:hypothetical protein
MVEAFITFLLHFPPVNSVMPQDEWNISLAIFDE